MVGCRAVTSWQPLTNSNNSCRNTTAPQPLGTIFAVIYSLCNKDNTKTQNCHEKSIFKFDAPLWLGHDQH